MVYLQDSDDASRLYALDRRGVHRLSSPRSRLLRRTIARRVSGHLGYIEQKPAAIYAAGGRLWFAIEGQPWLLDELKADVTQTGDGHTVEIATPGRSYRIHVDPGAFEDTTPFADVEDRSFGLWVARLVNDSKRQEVLREVLLDAPVSEVPDHASGAEHTVALSRSWREGEQGASPTRPERSAE